MPKSKLNRPKVDKALALILERKRAYSKTNVELGKYINVSESKMQRMLKAGTQTWTVGDLFKLARALDIPKEEMRAAL